MDMNSAPNPESAEAMARLSLYQQFFPLVASQMPIDGSSPDDFSNRVHEYATALVNRFMEEAQVQTDKIQTAASKPDIVTAQPILDPSKIQA